MKIYYSNYHDSLIIQEPNGEWTFYWTYGEDWCPVENNIWLAATFNLGVELLWSA